MSVDLEHIAGQIGTATMDYLSGKIIKSTGDLEDNEAICSTMYSIVLDALRYCGSEPLKRITINYGDCSFLATISDKVIYIVKTQPV